MYLPPAFDASATADRAELVAFMREHNFATVVSTGPDGAPFASHLPVLVDDSDDRVTLRAHVARANPHAALLDPTRDVLVIFHGPHAYISPTLYVADDADRRVPTWNYAVVHATGRPRLLSDDESVRMLAELTQLHERGREAPWIADLTTPARLRLVKAIVGFAIEVTRLEGKRKLSQNRAASDRRRVHDALASSARAGDRELAALMARHSGLEDPPA